MKRLCLIIVLALALSIPATVSFAAGPWKGKVVESATKKPIEGAVVVAVWYSQTRLKPAGSSRTPLHVEETMTNANGEFVFVSRSFVSITILREVSGPDFLIYKPGYETYENATLTGAKSDFDEKKEFVELKKVETKEERLKALRVAESFNLVIRDLTPLLNKLVKEENNCL